MTGVLSALAPVFGLIAVGYLLKSRRIFTDDFWDPAGRLTFYFLFPALLITSIGGAEAVGPDLLPMATALVVATGLMAGAMIALRPRLAKAGLAGPSFVSVFQGAIRPNTYVGIAAAMALFGDAGLTLTAAAIIAVIPLVNFLAIVGHLRWAGDSAGTPIPGNSWGEAVAPALKNPIIIACLLGAVLNVTRLGLPPIIGPILKIIGHAALPLGLMAVGAGLDFTAVRKARNAVIGTAVLKLAVTPGVTYAACQVFGVTGPAAAVAVMFMALPVSAASYVMSRQLGGDGSLIAGIVTATTLGAAVTLPLAVVLAG